MQRRQIVFGVLGLMLVAATARAAAPKEIKLFGQTYNVETHSLGGAYKNGLAVVQPTVTDGDNNRKSALYFAQGENAEQDRMFVVAPINGSDDTGPGHQFYMLRGADSSGIFNQQTSILNEYFGGSVLQSRGGRPANVMLIHDRDTNGKGKDRNLIIVTLAGSDAYRFLDLDTLDGDHISNTVFGRAERNYPIDGDEGDPNAPYGGFVGFAPGPRETIVLLGRSAGGSAEISVWDPTQDQCLNVLTDLEEAFADLNADLPHFPHALARYSEGEYWMLYSSPQPDANADARDSNLLVRLQIQFPADLATAEPGSIQVKVLESQELLGMELNATPGGIQSVTLGRADAAGRRTIYMSDWGGNLITLMPVAPTAGP